MVREGGLTALLGAVPWIEDLDHFGDGCGEGEEDAE